MQLEGRKIIVGQSGCFVAEMKWELTQFPRMAKMSVSGSTGEEPFHVTGRA